MSSKILCGNFFQTNQHTSQIKDINNFKVSLTTYAFTLAEVLITLGIIGIVAAMTLPAILQKTKEKEVSSRLKKFVSTINQTLMFAENDYGLRENWNISNEMHTYEGAEDFIITYIKPYVKNQGIEKRTLYGYDMAAINFSDGSQMNVTTGTCYDIYFDINGNKKPNEKGKDIFRFIFCRRKASCNYQGNNNTIRPYYCQSSSVKYPTRNGIIQECKTSGVYCTILLEENNWEFPKDYPLKL